MAGQHVSRIERLVYRAPCYTAKKGRVTMHSENVYARQLRGWTILAVLGAAAGCRASHQPPQAVERATQALLSANGFGQNGLTTNGLISNGFISNGFISNGFISNGFISNGLASNGFISNGFISNGFISNGFISNGFISNGFISNGLAPNGFISNGFISNGFISNGVWSNGVWTNGFISNGFISNGFISNGLIADHLKSSQYARQLMQYIYSCAMPAGHETSVDLWNGTLPCGSGGSCDAGYACSSSGTCVMPLPGPGLGPGGQVTNPDGTTSPGLGLIGLGINADETHWWDALPSGDAGAPGDAGSDGGAPSSAGTCDETCQRWVSACVLARTNAYGVHVELSMRAPASASPQIQAALATSFPEVTSCADAGIADNDPGCGYTLREGAYYGNIFATTPAICDTTGCKPAPPPASGNGPATGPIAQTPAYYACAGPGSNIPEITKRFCSSQGDQVVINVPGVCLTNPAGELGTCKGRDSDAAGAIYDCYTVAGATGTHYGEVISVYLKQPIATCGNTVCESGEDDPSSPAYCTSDCHPGSWAKDLAPGSGQTATPPASQIPYIDGHTTTVGKSVVAPDDTIVVAGDAYADVDFGGGILAAANGVGILAKYNPDGSYVWGRRFGATPGSTGYAGPNRDWQVKGVAVAPTGGNITVFGTVNFDSLWVSTFGSDGSLVAAPAAIPAGSFLSDYWHFLLTAPDQGAIAVSPQGNAVIAGDYSNGSIWRVFVAVVSPQGAVTEQSLNLPSAFGGGAQVRSLVLDPSGNIVILVDDASNFSQLMKLCPDGTTGSAASSGSGTVCSNGSTPWSKFIGNPQFSGSVYFAANVDTNGDVYGAGVVGYNTDFGLGPITSINTVNYPPVLVKYKGTDGTAEWQKLATVLCPGGGRVCSSQRPMANAAIGFDHTGNVIFASLGDWGLGGDIQFAGPLLSTFPMYNSNNVFLSAFSTAGQPLWSKQIPIILSSNLLGMALDSKSRIVMSGDYSGSMQTDDRLLVTPDPESPGFVDTFVSSFGSPQPGDTTAPGIGTGPDHNTVPPHIVVDATSAAGAIVFFMPPTATDSSSASVYCTPPPNTMFRIGDTPVTCIASDPQGNKSDPKLGTFIVTVRDTFGPAFTPSTVSDITVPATSASGAAVSFAPTATDVVDGPVTPVCKPLSGTAFPVGTSPVVCEATDKAGNQTVAAFTVTVSPGSVPPAPTTPTLTPPTVTCVGSQNAPASVSVPQGVCGVALSGASGTAGTCTGGGGGLASCTLDGQTSETLGAGPHSITVLGTAGDGSTASCTSYVNVVDNQNPAIQCNDQKLECTGNSSATTTPTATCTDNCSCTASCVTAAFPLGTSPGSCSAKDPSGNTASCQPNITVVDTIAPVLTLPPAPAPLQCTTGVLYTPAPATATDACTVPTVTQPPAVDQSKVGTTQAVYMATDGAGNQSSAAAAVTVVDTLPPVVTPRPGPSQLQCGVDTWSDPGATALDQCVGDVSASVKTSGIVDPMHVGSYSVGYSATDPSGNTGSATRAVTVIDSLAPGLSLPGTVTTAVTSSSGALVTYPVSAADRCDGAVAPGCTPASGSSFAPGITTVTCTAADSHGNKAAGSFQVQVQYAWSGILQPINPDGSSIFKLGSTVPVIFQLTGASAVITNAVATLSVAKVTSTVEGTDMEAVSTSAATTGNAFRYDATSGQYIFNLATKPLSIGTWQLLIDLHDGVTRTVIISLR
jgi:hypothetical protein